MKSLHIAPDYTLPVADVYKDLICQYIGYFGTLEILQLCDLRNKPPDFMSFVPNFAVASSESRLLSGHSYVGSVQNPMYKPGGTLTLSGKFVATIDFVSEFRKPLGTDLLDKDKIIEVIKTYHHWEPPDLMTAVYPPGGTLLDAYILLLAGGVQAEINGPRNQLFRNREKRLWQQLGLAEMRKWSPNKDSGTIFEI